MSAKHTGPHSGSSNITRGLRGGCRALPALLMMSLWLLDGGLAGAWSPARLAGLPAGATSIQVPVCPPGIGFGETIQCSISSPGEVDTYTFEASAGDTVLVRMSTSSGGLWPRIRVAAPGGTELCDTYSSASAEIASCSLTSGGTHSILASDHFGTETGDYYLYLQRLNNPGNAVPIAFGQTLPGSILSPAELDTYTFAASAGDKVLVRMSTSSGSMWPQIRVIDPGGVKLCDTYSSDNAEIASCTLTSDGTYSLLAGAYGGIATGDYYLYLQRLNNPGNAVPIAFGQTLPGSIPTSAELDTYTFEASAGDTVLVRMSTGSGDLWPQVRVIDPGGVKLCDTYSSASAEIASCTLTSDGTHSILAGGYWGTDTGDYYLYLQRLNNPGNAVPIAFGQTLPGSILSPAELDTYTFAASAGDTVLVRMSISSGSMWPQIRVIDPGGVKLCDAYSSDNAEIASCTLTSDGTYSLLAGAYGGIATGDYYLYLQRLNNPGNAVPIAFGQTLPGSIPTSAELDTYTFEASAGDTVLVRMSTGSGDLWPQVRVIDPGGVKLCDTYSSASAEIASCTLTSDGTHSILAGGYWGTDTGDYYLYLQRLNNPGNAVPIERGTVAGGAIDSPAEVDTYTFTAAAIDQVRIRMTRVSGSFWPGVRVYNSAGIKLCEGVASGTVEIAACALSGTGTYSILAFDGANGTLTGAYRLGLDCCRVYLPVIHRTH